MKDIITLISKVRSGLEAGYDLDTAVINAINYLKEHYEISQKG